MMEEKMDHTAENELPLFNDEPVENIVPETVPAEPATEEENSHKIWQEENLVLAKLTYGLFFCFIVFSIQYLVAKPFVTGRR